MADLGHIIVLCVCVLAFVLLTLACAGNSWVDSNMQPNTGLLNPISSHYGLWKSCAQTRTSREMICGFLQNDWWWISATRALSVISVSCAAFASLVCLAGFFLKSRAAKFMRRPVVVAIFLLVAGTYHFLIALTLLRIGILGFPTDVIPGKKRLFLHEI